MDFLAGSVTLLYVRPEMSIDTGHRLNSWF